MVLRCNCKGNSVNKAYRFIILALLIAAAISAYSYGSSTGIFVFVILGFAFEGMFWMSLFRHKKQSNNVIKTND